MNFAYKIFFFVGALVLVTVAAMAWMNSKPVEEPIEEPVDVVEITSFEECVAALYPVMESHPRRCAVPGGEVFVEDIGSITYNNATEDMIRVELPYPGAVVGKEFVVVGEARGPWFFEATFALEVLSPDGNVIAGTYATAQEDWMTTDFVPFRSEMFDLPSAYTGPATLVLYKQNASGLPENEASISFPIIVEY